jgi:pimeloyl-ACP methyl ester carboxylesterase
MTDDSFSFGDMGSVLAVESYWPFRQMLFPRPHPMRSWTLERFDMSGGAGVPPYVVYTGANEPGRVILIHCHGNASDCEAMSAALTNLAHRTQTLVVSWEYPGYGPRATSEYSSAEQMRRDIVALFDHLAAVYPTHAFVVYGQSLGTGPAIWLASQRTVAGLILQSPYTSISAIVKDMCGWAAACMVPSVFDNATAIRDVRAPILCLHGQRDMLIPAAHSEELIQRAVQSPSRVRRFAPFATHNDWDTEEDVVLPICKFLRAHV